MSFSLARIMLVVLCMSRSDWFLKADNSHSCRTLRSTEMEIQERKCRSLVLVPFPFQGHINPMLQLGTILHSKGFSITVAHTHLNSPDGSKHPDFLFLPLLDGSSSKPKTSEDFMALISELNSSCRAPFQEVLTHTIEKQKLHDELPCIIYDALMYFAEVVASDLKLPSINLRTGNATNLLTLYAYPRLQEEGYIPLQDSKLMELVPGFQPLRFKDLAVATFKNLDTALQLVTITLNRKTSSAIICNTMDFLEKSTLTQLQQFCQVPVFSIGPMHKMGPVSSSSLLEEDTSCISWLDKQKQNSVIYVSLGSVIFVDENEVKEMAWGLANSNQPFLWVIRPGSVQGSESTDDCLPEGFKATVGERGCIVKWAPQKEVLMHSAVGGFWSHCGWNSTLESISEGVPMICRPCFGDQRIIARYVSHVWKVGLELENDLERGEVERAIKRLMVEKEGEEMRQRALDLKVKSELCVQKGGSSYYNLNKLVELITLV